jgi:hypothetical protein
MSRKNVSNHCCCPISVVTLTTSESEAILEIYRSSLKHNNPYFSFSSLSFFPLCIRRGFNEKFAHAVQNNCAVYVVNNSNYIIVTFPCTKVLPQKAHKPMQIRQWASNKNVEVCVQKCVNKTKSPTRNKANLNLDCTCWSIWEYMKL